MGFHGNKILRTLVGDVIRLAGVTSFVETGTCTGITTECMALLFPKLPIFSCEIDPQYYAGSVERLRPHGNVKIAMESSEKFITRLIAEKSLGDMPMFFLDAHWYDYWPLVDEVAVISSLPKFAVIVDDFRVPGQGQFETSAGGGGTPGVHRTKVDSRPCDMTLVGHLLSSDCEVAYPAYGKTEAYGTPNTPHLVGHVLICKGVSGINELKTSPYYVWGTVR